MKYDYRVEEVQRRSTCLPCRRSYSSANLVACSMNSEPFLFACRNMVTAKTISGGYCLRVSLSTLLMYPSIRFRSTLFRGFPRIVLRGWASGLNWSDVCSCVDVDGSRGSSGALDFVFVVPRRELAKVGGSRCPAVGDGLLLMLSTADWIFLKTEKKCRVCGG